MLKNSRALKNLRPALFSIRSSHFLYPHMHVTNLGYFESFFRYSENLFHSTDRLTCYNHDSKGKIFCEISDVRAFHLQNIFTAELWLEGKLTEDVIKKDWAKHSALITELGSCWPEYRFHLRNMHIYKEFKCIEKESQKAILKCVRNPDIKHLKSKLKDMKERVKVLKKLRQQRLHQFEFDRLSKCSYEAVEYDLEKRGYLLYPIAYKMRLENPNLTKEQIKIAALKDLKFDDKMTAKQHLFDFYDDYSLILQYEEEFDLKSFKEKSTELFDKAVERLDEYDNVKTKEEAEDLLKSIYLPIFEHFKPVVKEILQKGDSRNLGFKIDKYSLMGKYFLMRKKFPNDPFGLCDFLLSGKFKFPATKFLGILYFFLLYFANKYVDKRREEYEEKHNVLVGNRSRYFFSTEEQFKGEH